MNYLLLSILSAVLLYVCFRLIGTYKLDKLQVIASNYFVAVILGISIWQEPIVPKVIFNSSWFFVAIVIGISFIIMFYLFALSSAKAGIAITAVSSKMSVLIPVIAGFLFYGDSISYIKVLAIVLALFSFLLVFWKRKRVKIDYRILLLPILIFLGSGINDLLTKHAHYNYLMNDEALFLTTIFFFSFIFSLISVAAITIIKGQQISGVSLLFGLIVGVVNFGTMYYLLKALSQFEASVLFPILNVSVVLASSVIGILFFKERLTKLNWAGVLMAALSIVLISTNW